jgi:hypothetical protein
MREGIVHDDDDDDDAVWAKFEAFMHFMRQAQTDSI